MRSLRFRQTSSSPASSFSEAEFLEAERRLVGVRVQADVPAGDQTVYQKGKLIRLTVEREALVECDGSFGTVWVPLDNVTALEAY